MRLTPEQERVLLVIGKLTGGEVERPAENDDVARQAGLQHHQWSAIDDELVKLGLVNPTTVTNHTELTNAGASEYRRRVREGRAT